MKKLWLYLFVFGLVAGQAYSQTTTVAAETSNNTSASSTFPGLTDFRTTDLTTTPSPWTLGAAIETNPFDITPANVSKVNVHKLMDPSFTGKILVETQTWFCNQSPLGSYSKTYSSGNTHSFSECAPHLDVGYDSNDQVHANSAIAEMFSRGLDGFMADTSGGAFDCRTGPPSGTPLSFTFTSACPSKIQLVDGAISKMMTAVNQNHPNQMVFFLAEDQSAFDGQENCQTTDANQALCIAQKIESDVNYYNLTYFFPSPNNNAYLKNSNGSAMIAFFVAEEHQGVNPTTNLPNNPIDLSQCDSGPSACVFENGTTCGGTFVNSSNATVSNCWTSIWNAVRAHAPVPLTMLFRNAGGFTHAQSDGAYAWVDPNPATGTAITTTTQEDWRNTFPNSTSNELDSFYAAAECTRPGGTCAGKLVFGIAKKGFDREDAPFQDLGLGHVTAQQCGQVWIQSFKEPYATGHFSATNPLPFMLVGTWDDYEEGTEIETGIDNCLTVTASSGSGSDDLLTWGMNPQDPHAETTTPPSTVDHFTVYSSTDGQNLTLYQDNMPCCALDLLPVDSLPNGTYQFFVKAVGKSSIQNRLSSGVNIALKDFALRQSSNPDGSYKIFLSTRPGYTGTVSLSFTTNGATASLSPTSITATTSSALNVTWPTAAGDYVVTVTGADAATGTSSSVSVSLFIAQSPYLVVPAVSPTSATVTAGNSTTYTVTSSSGGGFNSTVALSASGLPSGAAASFNPTSIAGGSGSSQMTISTGTATPAGTYTITVTTSGGGLTQSQNVSLTVDPPPPPPTGGGGTCTTRICLNQ